MAALISQVAMSFPLIQEHVGAWQKEFATPTLEESNYLDFDGVSQYTIETV